jgi:hypothetical protein
MGQSAAEIILGLTQIGVSREATNLANRRLDIEQDEKRKIQEISDAKTKKADDKETARLASGAAGFDAYRLGIEEELKQGLITYEGAKGALERYGVEFELNPREAVLNLNTLYTKNIRPGRNAAAAAAAYQESLGREPTDKEKKNVADLFETGYYKDVQALKDSLVQSSEYKDKFNNSYIDNYYDTMYGKQQKDAEGKKTGIRSITFDKSLLPTYAKGTLDKAGITIPDFQGTFTGTGGKLDEDMQNIRDTRKYLYSAGLTNLQGDIDKETQKLKNKGATDVAKIGSTGDMYKALIGSFSFN